MRNRHVESSEEATHNLVLLIESARDLVGELRQLSQQLDENLQKCVDLDMVISLLREKKDRVDTLRRLATEIRARLRVTDKGEPGIQVSESSKLLFNQLMADLRDLLEKESRLESLICGCGLTISRGVR
jgi:hypothetical protein